MINVVQQKSCRLTCTCTGRGTETGNS